MVPLLMREGGAMIPERGEGLVVGPGRLCRHCFEHNRSLKALSIIGHIIYDL